MNTNPISVTTAVSSTNARHRTLVALPVFAVLIIGSMMQGAIVRGDVIGVSGMFETKDEQTVLPLPFGGQAVLLPGAEALIEKSVVLEKGEMIVNHVSLATVHAGPFVLEGWRGAFGAAIQGESVTVVALTTPVLVLSGEQRMIVPAGSQVRLNRAIPSLNDGISAWAQARTVLPLPAHYVRERLEMLQDIPQPTVAVRSGEGDWSMPPVLDTLRLPSARQRSQEELDAQRLADLFLALRMGDAARIQTSLLDEELQEYLKVSVSKRDLPDIISLASQSTFMPLFLPLALRDESFWMLASAHPFLRDHAWVTSTDLVPSDESRMVRLFSVPRADLQPEGMSSLSVERWQQELTAMLADQSASEGPAVLDAFIPHWTEVVRAQAQANLPERTQRYSSIISSVAAPYETRLAADTLLALSDVVMLPVQLAGVRLEDAVSAASSEESSSSSVSSQSVSSAASETQDGVTEAVAALRAAGGMETPHTAVSALGPRSVHVVGMIFATENGDLPFEFSYDASTNEVSDILKDGAVLPYAVPLEQFVAWAKKGMK